MSKYIYKYENGLEKIHPVKKTNIKWYPEKRKKVLAIDFGTSTIAVAYKAGDGCKCIPIKLNQCRDSYYLTTVLLITADSKVVIGDQALLTYTKLETTNFKKCILFDRVKLHLQYDKNVGRQTYITASNGRSYYLIEVIALFLKTLRDSIQKYFDVRGGEHRIDEFHWILTIPALWGKRARDMMREAAYLGELCSNHSFGGSLLKLPLKPTYTHYPPLVKESNPEHLSLVYEPDAAATVCQGLTPDDVQSTGDAIPPLTTNECFLTIDIGGGTIDVTGHQILDNQRMKRVDLPHGEVYGGTAVNESFKVWLSEDIVNDTSFNKYLVLADEPVENRAELLGLVYVGFEEAKKRFADNYNDETVAHFSVTLPTSFAEKYHEKLMLYANADISKGDSIAYKSRTQNLYICKEKMAVFFEQSIKKIYKCIDRVRDDLHAQNCSEKLKILYLVGEFGGCPYIASTIRMKYGSDAVKVMVPTNQELAVVKGACEYHEKDIFENADATYGIETCVEYDENNPIHVNGELRKTDDGKELCEKLFQPFIQKGDQLDKKSVYIGQYLPLKRAQTTVTFFLYSTPKPYVNYTYGQDGDCLTPIATITIENKGRCKKKVEFLLDFSGTEIQVYAGFDEHNGERVKASVDFLSSFSKFELI